jgi:hypothetical protein
MRHIKKYKLFESSENKTKDILFDLNDIFIELEDYDFTEKFIMTNLLPISHWNWQKYSIKNNILYIGNHETKTDFSSINGFSFLIKVDLKNFEDVKYTLLRAFKYMKDFKNWEISIFYSFYNEPINMPSLGSNLGTNEINKLIDDLKIIGTTYSYEQVPKWIKFNTYKK